MSNKSYKNTGYETNLVLSKNIKVSFNTFKTRLGSMNCLVIGGTGEGKSRYVVRPIVYSLPCDSRKITVKDSEGKNKEINPKMSFVFTDPKGELCRDTAGFLAANGYKIKIFNLVDMQYSDCYNPFKYAKDDTAITVLIDGLVDTSTGGGGKDPHWGNMAKAVLNALSFYMFYELPAEMQNFTTLSKLVPLLKPLSDDDARTPFDNLLDITIKNSPLGDLHPAVVWRRKISATGGELSSIISTAQAAVRLWADISVQKMTEVDTLNLDTIGDEPTAVYVITPTTNSTYDFLVATFYNQLFETLMYKANMVYHGGLPHHVLVVQDEFANTGKIPDYDKKIATFRSCNISSIIIVQSPNQIESMYEGKAQDIIDNTHIQIFLGNGGKGEKSAPTWMSKALGKTTVKAESYSINYQDKEIQGNVNSSIGSNERDLMTTDEIARLPADECLIMMKGYKPFRDKKIDLDTCLNFGSDLFTDKKANGQRKLKKQFDYSIESNKKTLESFILGKKELKDIDKKEYDELKRILIRNSEFASFEDPYSEYYINIENEDLIENNIFGKPINDDVLYTYIKNKKLGYIEDSVFLTSKTNSKIYEAHIEKEESSEKATKSEKKNNKTLKSVEAKIQIDVLDEKHLLETVNVLKEMRNIKSEDEMQDLLNNVSGKSQTFIKGK